MAPKCHGMAIDLPRTKHAAGVVIARRTLRYGVCCRDTIVRILSILQAYDGLASLKAGLYGIPEGW